MTVRILPIVGLATLVAFPALAQSTRPPAQVTVTNARTAPLTTLEIATGGEQPRVVGKLSRPLAPGKTATVKLDKPQGCSFSVLGRFSDEVENEQEDWNLCQNRTIRFTD